MLGRGIIHHLPKSNQWFDDIRFEITSHSGLHVFFGWPIGATMAVGRHSRAIFRGPRRCCLQALHRGANRWRISAHLGDAIRPLIDHSKSPDQFNGRGFFYVISRVGAIGGCSASRFVLLGCPYFHRNLPPELFPEGLPLLR